MYSKVRVECDGDPTAYVTVDCHVQLEVFSEEVIIYFCAFVAVIISVPVILTRCVIYKYDILNKAAACPYGRSISYFIPARRD